MHASLCGEGDLLKALGSIDCQAVLLRSELFDRTIWKADLAITSEHVIMSSEHSFLFMKEHLEKFAHLEYFRHADTSTRA